MRSTLVASAPTAKPTARFASAGVNPSADNGSNSMASMMMKILRFARAPATGASAEKLRARSAKRRMLETSVARPAGRGRNESRIRLG
jgi:hypothetical protein